MANYQSLKAAINAAIKANGNKEITGTVLNEVLLAMVNSLGAGYQFAGVATPDTTPGTPDQKVFYIASQAGTYTNFGGAVISNGIAIFKWNGTWTTETLDLPIPEQVQSDWTEDDPTKKSYIKHKPNIPEEQVQSDWTETDTTKKSYIKHKPNIPPSANVDPVPTEDSPNAVSSGGVYDVTHGTLKTRYIPFDLRGESILFLSDEDMTELFGPATMVGGQSMFDLTVGEYQHIYRVTNSKSEVFEIPAAYSNVNGARKIVGINGNLTIELSFTITNGVYINAAIAKRETSIPGISYEEEQDLTPKQQVQAQNNMMSKVYAPAQFSGLGKKVLSKNMQTVGGVQKNVMTQAFFQDSQGNALNNTIFVIQYDYDINGTTIEIPDGCVLDFQGGSISNGTIIFNNTKILSQNNRIFSLNTNISGSQKFGLCPEWFGYVSSPSNDAAPYFYKILNAGFDILLLESTYYINSQVVLPTRYFHVRGFGNDSIINIQYNGFAFVYQPIAGQNNGVDIIIDRIQVQGDFPYVGAADQTETLTSFFKNEEGTYIYSCRVSNLKAFRLNEVFHLEKGYWTRINNCVFTYCKNVIHGNDFNSSSFTDNQFRWVKEHSLWISDSNGASPGTNGISILGNDFSSNSASTVLIDGIVSSMAFIGNYIEPAIEQYIPNSVTYGIQIGVANNNYGEDGVTIPSLSSSIICGNTGWAENRNSKRCMKVYGKFSSNFIQMSNDVTDAFECKANIGNNEYDDSAVKAGYSFLNIYDKVYVNGNRVTKITPRTLQVNQVTIQAGEEVEVASLSGRYFRLHNFNSIHGWLNVELVIYDGNDVEKIRYPLTEDSVSIDVVLASVGTFKVKIKNKTAQGGSALTGTYLINYSISSYDNFMV